MQNFRLASLPSLPFLLSLLCHLMDLCSPPSWLPAFNILKQFVFILMSSNKFFKNIIILATTIHLFCVLFLGSPHLGTTFFLKDASPLYSFLTLLANNPGICLAFFPNMWHTFQLSFPSFSVIIASIPNLSGKLVTWPSWLYLSVSFVPICSF